MIDLEITALIRDLEAGGFRTMNENGKSIRRSIEVDPRIHFQRMALNLTLMICFSTRFAKLDDPLLEELLQLALSVST